MTPDFFQGLGELRLFQEQAIISPFTKTHIESDKKILKELSDILKVNLDIKKPKKLLSSIKRLIDSSHSQQKIEKKLTSSSILFLKSQVQLFKQVVYTRLNQSKTKDLAKYFELKKVQYSESVYHALFPKPFAFQAKKLPQTATQWEIQNKELITQSLFISADFKKAREAWKSHFEIQLQENNHDYSVEKIEKLREKHFQQFPFLSRFQEIIDNGFHHQTSSQIDAILELLPIFPYAHYNWEQFKAEIGANVILEKLYFLACFRKIK